VLGSGDASQAFQTFILKNNPLTYVSASTPSGAETTLEVRVNDILWEEVGSLYQLGPRQRVYLTRIEDDGKVTVEFGDGTNGARLPSGDENVRAIYRAGTGASGMLKPGQLSLLMNRLLGVQKVVNPLAPTGAADPESREQARQNAPFTVLTLERIVSLQDFEDFAGAFAGIGKAQAAWLWDGQERILVLTVAASTPVSSAIPGAGSSAVDYRVDPKSDLYKNLTNGINAARDGLQRMQIDSYNPLLFRLRLRLLVDPAYLPEKVSTAVIASLSSLYAFERRSFGQSITRSELLALVQGIEGVQAAFLDKLFFAGQPETLQDPLVAQPARRGNDQIQLADLLLIDPNGIFVEAVIS
jgi:predicted phage baseplate assembly protein